MIKRAIIYFIIITAVLYGLRSYHWNNLLSQQNGYYAKYRTAFLERNDFDVLFLGSSRCAMHYNTMLFDSITGCNTFNLSLSGATPRVSLAALKAYLVNSKAPKYILFETDLHNIHMDGDIMEFNNYFPFLQNNILREEFNKIDKRITHFYYNAYYSWPYTGYKNISTGLRARFNITSTNDEHITKGFITESKRSSLTFKKCTPQKGGFSVMNRQYTEELIQFCNSKNIKLILVTSPMFAGGKLDLANKQEVVTQVDQLAVLFGLEHWNLSTTPYCNQRDLFIDHFHMNVRGARLFTCKLASLFSNKCQ